MGWKPEVKVSGEWSQNALVFATEEEAKGSACSLFTRWTLCEDNRAVQVDEDPTYKRVEGVNKPLTFEEAKAAATY